MIHAGDSIENPVTGERIVFRQTSRETGGEAVVIETYVKPNGFVAAAHVHASQEERFQVLRGSVGFKVGGKKLVAGPGQRLTVPAGTPHKFWNAGEETAHFVCEIRPALQFESLIETMFSLAADGKTNRKGMPNPLRLAVIARAHFDTVQLPVPPAILQRLALGLASPLGRALGYEPVYVPAAGTPATAPVVPEARPPGRDRRSARNRPSWFRPSGCGRRRAPGRDCRPRSPEPRWRRLPSAPGRARKSSKSSCPTPRDFGHGCWPLAIECALNLAVPYGSGTNRSQVDQIRSGGRPDR